MADKQVPLSIVLRTVDKATAGINAVNKRLDAITKPTRDFGKALKDLGEKSGLNAVVDGVKGVGGAIQGLIEKAVVVGGVLALAVHGVLGLVDEFDNLGDKAEQLDVTVDFLAAMRFAADRTGSSVESLDQGITSFGESMGQLRAGGGRMLKFLSTISPALVTQLKATKGNEAAFRLLADAMAKVTDPQKRLALAMNTVGNSDLAPLLARGSQGLLELQGEFVNTAGSMEDAAAAAGATDDALNNLKAATTGVKASLVTGLAPALTIIIEKLTKWFVDHREDVKRWAIEIGEKLPDAVERVVKEVKGAIDWATRFVDEIGGIKVAVVGVIAILGTPLLSSLATLGTALVGTPFGIVVTGLAAVTAGVVGVTVAISALQDLADQMKHSPDAALQDLDALTRKYGQEEGSKRFRAMHPEMSDDSAISPAYRAMIDRANLPETSIFRSEPQRGPLYDVTSADQVAGPTVWSASRLHEPAPPAEVKLMVEFTNAPKGLRVSEDPKNTAMVDLTVGHQMGYAP
jgi:hypothetical protein